MAELLVSHDATATIASGQTTSNAVEGRHHAAWLAVMPAAFTGTSLSFTTSVDGTTYQTLKTTTGTTVTADVAAATSLPLPPEVGHARWFKIVSNAAEGAARAIRLVGKTVAPAPVRAAAGGGSAGTEYTEGDTDATITGGAILWEDAADTLRAVSAAKPLPVNLVAGSSAGTEYVEDAAAPANPSAGALSLRRRDTLSAAEVTTDQDWVTANATAKGELYVKQTDSVAVTGTFWQATQPVSGTFWQATQPVSGTFWQATQPVSGTVTANAGTGPFPVSDNAGSLTVDAPVATPVAVRTSDGAAFFDPRGTVAAPGHHGIVVGGADVDPRTIRALTSADVVTAAQATAANLNAQVQGAAATDAAASGNPVYAGGRASTAFPTAVSADGDAVPFWLDRQGALLVRPRQKTTQTATFMLAARPYALSNAFAAAGTKQYATIYHTVASVKTVLLRRVLVAIESTSAAALVLASLNRLTGVTAPATGNPAISPQGRQGATDPSSEATCLALPTTAGSTSTAARGLVEWNLGITGAASTANPPPPLQWVDLLRAEDPFTDLIPYSMLPGEATGWAVVVDCSAAATVKAFVEIVYTEE